MSVLSDRHVHDEAAAYKFVEARIWPSGPVCPHRGGFEHIPYRFFQEGPF